MVYLYLLAFAAGFVVLHYSTSKIIDSSHEVGSYFNIPSWLVGSLMLAIGTSLPEAIITIASMRQNLGIIAFNNLIGSNITNVCVGLGVAWIMFGINKHNFDKISIIEMFLIQISLLAIMVLYSLNPVTASVLFLLFIGFITSKVIQGNFNGNGPANNVKKPNLSLLVLALFFLPLASYVIIYTIEYLADFFGITHAFIGMILVALGTSIPEIYSSALALKRDQANIAIGNIVGSNIVNSTLVMGLIGFLGGYQLGLGRELYDLIFMCVVVFLGAIALWLRISSKLVPLLLIGMYIVFLASWF